MSAAKRISDHLRQLCEADLVTARGRGEAMTKESWRARQVDELDDLLHRNGVLGPDETFAHKTFDNWFYGDKLMSLDMAVVLAEHFGEGFITALFPGYRAKKDGPAPPTEMLDAYSPLERAKSLVRTLEAAAARRSKAIES